MNITFLIGNGFDLNLGLKTAYSHFYEYYKDKAVDDLIFNDIDGNYEMWSDLERGLGKFLKKVDVSQIEDFLDSKGRLENLLSEYLSIEEQKIEITNEKALSEEFRNKIANLENEIGFSDSDREDYDKVIKRATENVNYFFITFNYTNILDRIIELTRKRFSYISTHSVGGKSYNEYIKEPLHIHGSVEEELILGLDNTNQIENDSLKNKFKLTDYMIKSDLNNLLGNSRISRAKEIINKSIYVCLFGLSIGETDGMWWEYLVEWLQTSSNKRLVLFVNESTKASALEKLRLINRHRDIMLERGQVNDSDIRNKIFNKIIVIGNSQIFNFKNITIRNNLSDFN